MAIRCYAVRLACGHARTVDRLAPYYIGEQLTCFECRPSSISRVVSITTSFETGYEAEVAEFKAKEIHRTQLDDVLRKAQRAKVLVVLAVLAAMAAWALAGYMVGETVGRGWRDALAGSGCELVCRR